LVSGYLPASGDDGALAASALAAQPRTSGA